MREPEPTLPAPPAEGVSPAARPQGRPARPALSAVVVTHFSAAEAAACVASLRAAFETERIPGEILLVDCGSGPSEEPLLARAGADRLLLLTENRGYSGGVNAGLARARSERLLLCNADVLFHPGSLDPLLSALEESSVGAAAPLAHWDAEGRIALPPGFGAGFLRELGQAVAGRWPPLDRRRFAGFARETLRLWSAGGRARHLSGAVLAARREVFDRAGRFDERFPFEYEETEWEDRVRARGLELRFVPSSRVRHLWAVSAARNPETGARREASRGRYRARRYGPLGRSLLERARRLSRESRARELAEPEVPARNGHWLALSPNASRVPFAGTPLETAFRLPEELARRLSPARWYWTVFDPRDGRPVEELVWHDRR